MTRWKSFTVETRREAVDAVSHFFTGRGSLGLAYDERLFGPKGDPADPLPPPDEITRLTAYFPWETDLHLLKKEFLEFLPVLAESFGGRSGAFVCAAEITDGGWAERWKENFTARRVGKRLVVRPSWEGYEAKPEEVVLVIDPGQAFGTGTHETTRMCLQLTEEVFADHPPESVLDVGTGTGILGIAAAKLGARRVVGVDTDPKAVSVASENARANGVEGIFCATAAPLDRIGGVFDLLQANLIAEILVDMKKDLCARAREKGALILSGILEDKKAWVEEEFAGAGASVARRMRDGQWAALLLRRAPAPR